ncbi:NAD(P)H-binding protein [Gordonia sp. LSe1-13]|uniref:NAD(P)H-binding protein n=1 Tax=Gordonia sesuvii TaxID=3116777 RepID=A0ABU7MKK8_9ACTN|nr:NAD(P)H-binding protein [Gordonia sp. LSe1-13]
MRLFVTGATGYVGSRLVCALLAAGHDVVVTSRQPETLRRFSWYDAVTAVAMDADDPASAHDAVQSAGPVDVLYYLVHGIGQDDFDDADVRAANNVALAARDASVGRIVYLGGFVPDVDRSRLSAHLRSRADAADALNIPGGPELVWLRAAVILGAGSTSFEIIRYVADRLAVIPEPSWTRNPMDPISIRDVIHYLSAVADPGFPAGAYDIAGPDVGVRYGEVLAEYLRAIGQPRLRLPMPYVSTRLVGKVAGRIVPVPTSLTEDLVTSLNQPMAASEHTIRELIPALPGGLTPMDKAIAASVSTPAPRPVCDLANLHHLADSDPAWAGGDLMRVRRIVGSTLSSTGQLARSMVSLLTG